MHSQLLSRAMFALGAFLIAILASQPLRADEGNFEAAGVSLHYVSKGTGQPLVLLNGLLGSAEKTWGPKEAGGNGLMAALAEQYRVIALDTRGQGRSDKPHDPRKYGIETVKDIVRLLDHLKIRQAHFLGYSMGGGIAARLLVSYPGRIRSMILDAPTMGYKVSEKERQENDFVIDALEHEDRRPDLIIAMTPPGQPKPTREQAAMIAQQYLAEEDPLALAAWVRAHHSGVAVTEAQMRANRVPVLIIYGSHDGDDADRKKFDEVAGLLRAQVHVVEGADHVTTPGAPDFLAAVSAFLEQHSH